MPARFKSKHQRSTMKRKKNEERKHQVLHQEKMKSEEISLKVINPILVIVMV